MTTLRLVSIGTLRQRLATALGPRDPVGEVLDRALERQDEAMLTEAMSRLRTGSRERARVEAAILAWLLGGSDAAALADLRPVNGYCH